MIFNEGVSPEDRSRIERALQDIEHFGDGLHKRLSRFIRSSELNVWVVPAREVGGSGSVRLEGQWAARRAVGRGGLAMFDAAAYVRLNVARETIDTGGQDSLHSRRNLQRQHVLRDLIVAGGSGECPVLHQRLHHFLHEKRRALGFVEDEMLEVM